ncbi:MAG: tetratricopeptide repeat protein [Chitinivibrionales bacterium]|nr:tetratricopeptide repeat protein [Chitinivibrionales bacterium]
MINNIRRHKRSIISVLLAVLVLVVYYPVTQYGFVNYDDAEYVTKNEHVTGGLTINNIIWAFTSKYEGNWHPLTWLSHMVDYEFFGDNASGHHGISIIIHMLNALLLFLVLLRLSQTVWRSALVAALFALHPINVESVAWIAERKNVLSTFFMLAAIWKYADYAKYGKRQSHILSFLYFCFGLMAKSMLVTFPFVLLLLDYWPLRRVETPFGEAKAYNGKSRPYSGGRFRNIRQLILEKTPFFLMAFIASFVAYMTQEAGKAIYEYPLAYKIVNSSVSYLRYTASMIWPQKLAIFYPFPVEINIPLLMIALGFIGAMTFLAVKNIGRFPWLGVGWFWYLGTLVPVIGIVKIGAQARADRYAYVPLIGLFIIFAWTMKELFKKRRHIITVKIFIACTILLLLARSTRQQIQHWHNGLTVFSHALKVTEGNYIAHTNIGAIFFRQGLYDTASFHFNEALKIKPHDAIANYNLGLVFAYKGDCFQSIDRFRKAIESDPEYAKAYHNMGVAFKDSGVYSAAEDCFKNAITVEADFRLSYISLGRLFFQTNRQDSSLKYWKRALELQSDDWEAHHYCANIYLKKTQMKKALHHAALAAYFNPERWELLNNLGTLLMNVGKYREATVLFSRAIALSPQSAKPYVNRGNSFVRLGMPDSALSDYDAALRINENIPEVHQYIEKIKRRK